MLTVPWLGLKSSASPLSHSAILSQRYISSEILRPRIYQEISRSRKVAAYNVERITREDFCVFTDGSSYRGGVGGAARARTPDGTIVMREHLGTTAHHCAVEGEILGIILGLKIIKNMTFITRATILVDCQQAIREMVSGKSVYTPLLCRFHEAIRDTKHLSHIRLAWVPGHHGIEMNKLVDKDAKEAALGDSTTLCF
ncbi:ribonuclease H-like domain-containing protein [Mycena epipterygia]|nr:ribonuclease H-like domain-containing protein [Mycena epipterygia]